MTAENKKASLIDEDSSRAITGVRFLLIVFVVFIHNVITTVNFADKVVEVEVPFLVDLIRHFISDMLGRTAVPTFFFISSYLLFLKNDSYKVLLKKKSISILLPYILWNALIAFMLFICQKIPSLKQYFATTIIEELDFKGWLGLFIGRDIENKGFSNALMIPLVYQFWFLRDLFLCILISPIIKKIVKNLPIFTFFAIIFLLNSKLLYRGIRTAVFYFTLGCFAVNFKLTYKKLERIKFSDICILYALILFCDFYFYFSNQVTISNFSVISIIVGGILLLKVSGLVCQNERIYKILKYLAGFSFWLYATHEPFLMTPIKKLWTRFLPINGYWLLIEYFGAVVLCVCISLGIGILLEKIFPKIYGILSGQR